MVRRPKEDLAPLALALKDGYVMLCTCSEGGEGGRGAYYCRSPECNIEVILSAGCDQQALQRGKKWG